MQRTRIEWVRNIDGSQGYTVNPVRGLCPVDCKDTEGKSYCYARRMYQRFGWNPEIRVDREAYQKDDFGIRNIKKSSRIFVGSTMELFGPWIPASFMPVMLQVTRRYPQHDFIFLTKRPWELKKYNPWPNNTWVGFSATDRKMFYGDLHHMFGVEAKVKFVSFEPLLEDIKAPDLSSVFGLQHLRWIIIGQRTPSHRSIPKEWVDHIVEKADREHVPIFCKDNLKLLLGGNLRQEWPKMD